MSKTPVKRGRPAGMRARQLELKQTLLEHPDVPKVLEKVVRTALDETHKNQTAAQKILMDRILPISTFDKQFDNREKITINVSVIGKESETLEGEVIEQ
jgi:DNA-directed RNA polymerase subunit K/omega